MKFYLISFLICFLFSCNENEIIIEQGCTEPPELSSYEIKLVLQTDITQEKRFRVNNNGYFLCENVLISHDSLIKNINIHGFICKNNEADIEIDYNDSLTYSKIRSTVKQVSSYSFNGKVYYCPNYNNICEFSEIGFVVGAISNRFEGSFVTPLFSGLFDVYLLNGQ